MADTKISALTGATTPLAGTEVIPVVQSGQTRKVSVANLTAGRAISATQLTLTTGNLIVANGQGIDFSATPGTGTSELLADYEEGTFTATLKGSVSDPTTPVTTTGRYTKIGNIVSFTIVFENVDTSGASGAASIAGLPFSASGRSPCSASSYRTLAFANQYAANASGTSVEFLNIVSGGDWTDATITDGGLRFLYANGSYGV